MNIKISHYLLTVLLYFVPFLITPIHASNHDKAIACINGGYHFDAHLENVMPLLALTDTQKQSVESIFAAHQADITSAQLQLQRAYTAGNNLIIQGKYSKLSAKNISVETAKARGKLAFIDLAIQQEIYQRLDTKQQSIWQAYFQA